MLVPPPGAKVAIIEWEDLECPACAHAFPFVHMAIDHYHIPYVRYDFLIPGHIWSREAAIYARYLQDKVSPELATQYRREVFASQFKIASKDDLNRFTQEFFAKNGKQLPFIVDPTGQLAREVEKDVALGNKLGLTETPDAGGGYDQGMDPGEGCVRPVPGDRPGRGDGGWRPPEHHKTTK